MLSGILEKDTSREKSSLPCEAPIGFLTSTNWIGNQFVSEAPADSEE